MKNERILISGAGIAGITAAYWLARNGFRPTVVERADTLRKGGQGVDIRDTAIEVAEGMGIMPRVRAAATDVIGMRFVDAAGNQTAGVDMRKARERNASREVEIMRGDLVGILHDHTADQVEYRFGDSIRALEQDAHGVTVTFEHAPAERFDLVIGADGLHSQVRRLAFGPEEALTRHMDHYFAFGNADPALGPDRWVTIHNTPGTLTGIYRSGNHPDAKSYFMFRSPRLPVDLRDPATARTLLSDRFADSTAWNVRPLLDAALADPDLYFDSLAQVRMRDWSTGRIALIGDAAHCASPVSGAGAELALVSAYRMATSLVDADGEHTTAFARYHDAHRPLVTRKQKLGPNLRLMIPKTRPGIAFRNTVTRAAALVG
ncbi:FAD-dependent monooxygenase [Nocardia sp. CDC153]|uniref:FAD-dependent monooxygenase n=1 Tax=Nocardia sp. CDC153 TaxID=3112167 RepID=UPI002DBB808C|nr:FAD-dependent monooxygenase [Nocardia sp. CDC153]MEC3953619.1 FAD-dependent monooxygenase [Nocardia sp. CDC153]